MARCWGSCSAGPTPALPPSLPTHRGSPRSCCASESKQSQCGTEYQQTTVQCRVLYLECRARLRLAGGLDCQLQLRLGWLSTVLLNLVHCDLNIRLRCNLRRCKLQISYRNGNNFTFSLMLDAGLISMDIESLFWKESRSITPAIPFLESVPGLALSTFFLSF